MNKKAKRYSDLVVMVACYLAPLLFSWPFSTQLTYGLAAVVLAGVTTVIYADAPTELSLLPKAAAGLLFFKAVVVSLSATPQLPALSVSVVLTYLFFLLISFTIFSSGERTSQMMTRFEKDALPGKLMAVDADLHAGNIDQKIADEKRERIHYEKTFYEDCDGLAWCLRYEVVGTFLTLLILGASEPLYLLAHCGISFFVSVGLGMTISRSASDSNLS